MTCPDCERKDAILADASDRLTRALEDEQTAHDITNTLQRTMQARLNNAEGKLRKQAEEVATVQVRYVFDRWRFLCNHRRAKLDPDRMKLISQALQRHGYIDVLKAIRGAARFPYVHDYKRCAVGHPDERHDKLDQILGSAAKLEKFYLLADRADLEDEIVVEVPPQVAVLAAEYGEGQVTAMRDELTFGERPGWWAPCPLHETRTMAEAPLLIEWGDMGDGLVGLRCARGCDWVEVARRIDVLEHGAQMGLAA